MTQWTQKRHVTGGNPKPRDERDLPDWRMRERLRTVTAALVMCLNIGVDPPDVSKTNPCSKLICWMDPSSIEVSKALPAIGKNLQAQFETLSMKTRYKQYLDPIVEETKRFCTSLRRTAKDERVLFYYNGFGVPKPTPGGEIWVFNKAYTQYIPVTLYDLQAWLGNPCIFVWDASSAGNVVVNFQRLSERKAEDDAKANGGPKPTREESNEEPSFPLRESIHLAACAPDEVLPMNPDLPADLFTCCLTSPIEISLRWFVLQNPLPSALNVDMVMNIPGRLQDRRTPLGELNWIFTAITDTIAWTVLPRTIFRRLFRDDLMVAALLRNYLLAERIMRFYHCTPMSYPKLPPTHNHPLWDSWDLAVDQCLSQLPTLLAKEHAAQQAAIPGNPPMDVHLSAFEYRHSTFFSEQLMAFEVWLSQGGVSRKGRKRRADASKGIEADLAAAGDDEDERPVRDPPDQLPIVLQVLLSQVHRLRALILLSQFLDLGPWAVNLALSIGIFPYVLKLLQSPAADLKPVLIYIWARILAVDRSCQNDLLRDNGFVYFTAVLTPVAQGGGAGPVGGANPNSYPIPNVSEHRAMCAFILSVFCQDFPAGQQACLQTDAMDSCFEHLDDDDFLLRQWSALCIGQLWDDSSVGKARGISKDVHGKLACMLSDISPEVRAAVLYALGILLGGSGSSWDPQDPSSVLPTNPISSKHAQTRPHCLGTGHSVGLEESKQRSVEIGVAISMLATKGDSSPLVRKELVIALSPLVREYQGFFVMAAYLYYDREERKFRYRDQLTSDDIRGGDPGLDPSSYEEALLTRVLSKLSLEEGMDEVDVANIPAFTTLFVSLLDLSTDSHPEVANMASTIVDYIIALLLETMSLDVRMGPFASLNRLVTPTSTLAQREDYFHYTPRSKMNAATQQSEEHPTIGLGQPPLSNGSARVSPRSSTAPPSHASHPKRAPSLAQTVKAIATLGYSRPSSPTNTPPETDRNQGHDTSAPAKDTYLPPRVPAPRLNSARYISPFAAAASDSPEVPASSPSTPATPVMAGSGSSAAHRSASAESLAQIARMQEKRNSRLSTTPVAGTSSGTKSPITERLNAVGLSTSQTSDGGANLATMSPRDRLTRTQQQQEGPSPDMKVADTLAAMIAIDLHRFRERASFANSAEGQANGQTSSAGNTPLPSPATIRQHGLHHGNILIREVLPLKSNLFAWCSEYYTEAQMKCAEADEPGSVKYNTQTWKRERNERIITEAQAETERATHWPWTDQVASIQAGAPVSLMLMHHFENHLVTASEQDTISVWDWSESRLLSRFNNGNPARTNITSMVFANEDANSRLLVGSADGDVRIYADYEEPSWHSRKGPTLVSSMRALPDLVRSKRPSGLILNWQQITGSLLAGGDSRVIRVWDAHRELCVCDIPTRVSSCVTSISSEKDVGHIYVCGFGDGTIGVYDRRIPPELSLVRLWEEHSNWITNICLQRRGNRELVSASADGHVKVWDIRGRNSLHSKDWSGELQGKLSSLAVHDNAPVFAISSHPKPQRFGMGPMRTLLCNIETMDLVDNNPPIVRHFAQSNQAQGGVNGGGPMHGNNANSSSASQATLSQAVETYPSQFLPSMTSLSFHPYYPILAFGGPDLLGNVSLLRLEQHSGHHHPYHHGGHAHIGMGILDSDEQRHIPSLVNGDHAARPKSIFGF